MSDRLRICYISAMFSPIIGGAEARAEKQARQLQALGHDVTIITPRLDRRWHKKEALAGLPVIRVGGVYRPGGKLCFGRLSHFAIDIALFLTLWRLRRSIDVIHVFQFSALAADAAIFGKLTGIPVVISTQCGAPDPEQGVPVERQASLLADTLTHADYLKLDMCNVVTDDITCLQRSTPGGYLMLHVIRRSNAFYQALSTRSKAYLASQGFREDHIVHIPGSVNIKQFHPIPEKHPDPALPKRLIVCVARLEYNKGVDVLLHAWGRMMHAPAAWRARLTPKLLLVGEGVLRVQLERMAADLDIQETVTFLGLQKNVLDYLQEAWGFVLPSRWEGMPNALLEAMACGLPCIATRVSGSEDVIVNGLNGLMVEPEQSVEMAHALQRIIEDTELAQRLGQEARATVVRDYQLPAIVDQCLELYRRMLHTEASRTSLPMHPQEDALTMDEQTNCTMLSMAAGQPHPGDDEGLFTGVLGVAETDDKKQR